MYKFRSNTFSKSQIPSLIPGHEEKCSVVIGCCRFAASMQHIYLQSSILRASTVSQTLISVHKEIVALVLAIAPKEQSNGMCAVICRSESSCLQHRGAWRPTTQSGKLRLTHIRVDIPRIPTLGIGGFFSCYTARDV